MYNDFFIIDLLLRVIKQQNKIWYIEKTLVKPDIISIICCLSLHKYRITCPSIYSQYCIVSEIVCQIDMGRLNHLNIDGNLIEHRKIQFILEGKKVEKFTFENQESTLVYSMIIEKFKAHIAPKWNLTYLRYLFSKYCQENGQFWKIFQEFKNVCQRLWIIMIGLGDKKITGTSLQRNRL